MPQPSRPSLSTLRSSTYSLSSIGSRSTYAAPSTPLPAYVAGGSPALSPGCPPPPAYDGRASGAWSTTSDDVAATLADVRAALFTQDAAPATCKLAPADVDAVTDAAAARHGLAGAALDDAREAVRAEWREKVGARRRRVRLAWAAGAATLVCVVVVVVCVAVPHGL